MKRSIGARVAALESEAATRARSGRQLVTADADGLSYPLEGLCRGVPLRRDVVEVRMYKEADGFRFRYKRRPDIVTTKPGDFIGSETNPHRDRLPAYFYFFKAETSFNIGDADVRHIAEAGRVKPVEQVFRGDLVTDEAGFREYLDRLDQAVHEDMRADDEQRYLQDATGYYSDRYKMD